MGVFKTGFLINTQWKHTISAPVLTVTAAWLKVSLPQKVLVFLTDLGGGLYLRQIYLQKTYTHWGPRPQRPIEIWLNALQHIFVNVTGWCIFCCWRLSWMMSRDKLLLLHSRLMSPSRLSGSLELLCWVPDERDVTQRLFLNMMALSSISISSSVYLMRRWDKEIPECSPGGL